MNTRQIGPYTQGEIPEQLAYQFQDFNGEPLALGEYTNAWFQYKAPDGIITDKAAAFGNSGVVSYTWVDGDISQPGTYTAHFWIEGSGKRLASVPIVFNVYGNLGQLPGA